MSTLRVTALAAAGPPEALPDGTAWLKRPGVAGVLGAEAEIDAALGAYFPPLKLRRLDSYSKAALLAAKLAREAVPDQSASPALIVCTGLGPVPATNAFMESFLEFGASGASPTAFSQTVHNMAASTISMFLDLRGPATTVSQPGLGITTALETAWAWLAMGQAGSVLLGAVDDGQPFAGLLSAAARSPTHAPLAVFALLAPPVPGGGGLLNVEFPQGRLEPLPDSFFQYGRDVPAGPLGQDASRSLDGDWTSPAAALARFALALNEPGERERTLGVMEHWRGDQTLIRVRPCSLEDGE
jgi:3-oxoacyl-[acyl-carrier-protein] synthase II